MKTVLLFAILLLSFTFAQAQHEYAPLAEKEVKYKDWTYKQVRDGKELNLLKATKGKKLVMVVYFAPWCPNWKLQAPVAEKLYEKYKASGFEIIGVGEYDTVDAMKASLDNFKITFPVVYESESRDAKQTTPHFTYRRTTSDTRNWGSPWSIFLVPSQLKSKGEFLTEKTFVVNGELMEAESEAFIREKLGLPKEEKKAEVSVNKPSEVCDPSTSSLRKP
ncbi:MAG TPA: TlpA disulfide reductase family protein [Pyrinomonadaceae bacterium]|jgi:thiol-disulfide isomerase/thioredoxin|nr:TlpA disulfide reductase family protein [Pyrinomonadaceae bacterium]